MSTLIGLSGGDSDSADGGIYFVYETDNDNNEDDIGGVGGGGIGPLCWLRRC